MFPQFLLLQAIRMEASEIQTVGFKQGTLPAQICHGTISDDLSLVEDNQPFVHRGGPGQQDQGSAPQHRAGRDACQGVAQRRRPA